MKVVIVEDNSNQKEPQEYPILKIGVMGTLVLFDGPRCGTMLAGDHNFGPDGRRCRNTEWNEEFFVPFRGTIRFE